MAFRFYNTLHRRAEIFKPLKKGEVGLYTCGPTVYNYAHIGNLRTYIFEDILQRTLENAGYKVKRVMNITDVGHLTGDADAGEDKIEKEATAEKKSPLQIASFYTEEFLKDIKKLNIEIPGTIAPATQSIPEQISLVKQLFKKGYAYETGQAVYFDVSKFKKYGWLSGQPLKEKIVQARKEVQTDPQKKNPADFALWFKLAGKFKNHILRWPSPWGEGFPGWHLECSAISREFLGQPFDIHTGGVDHIGTHHENEIAQSEAAYGKPLARYWLHGEFLLVEKKKMAKSEKNFFILRDLEKKGFSPLAFREMVLGTHYRKKLNFTWRALEAAEKRLEKIRRDYAAIKKNLPGQASAAENKVGKLSAAAAKYEKEFSAAVDDDLNTPRSLALLSAVIKDKKLEPKEKIILMDEFDKILGLDIKKPPKEDKIPEKIAVLAAQREKYRANKQFIQADALRKKINDLGFVIEDSSNGPAIRHK